MTLWDYIELGLWCVFTTGAFITFATMFLGWQYRHSDRHHPALDVLNAIGVVALGMSFCILLGYETAHALYLDYQESDPLLNRTCNMLIGIGIGSIIAGLLHEGIDRTHRFTQYQSDLEIVQIVMLVILGVGIIGAFILRFTIMHMGG